MAIEAESDAGLVDATAKDGSADAASPEDRSRPRALSVWLFVVAALVFVMIVVGGTTRLTQSGLSMVRWEPVSGVVPPLSQAAWQAEFDSYKAYPEYQKINRSMDLSEFKGIFFWEYLHRLLGRVLGLAMVVPFAWFVLRGAVPRGYGRRLAVLVALVGLQGAIGWWMVASGLIDRPDVAHERLALHLSTALILLVGLLWTALDMRALAAGRSAVAGRPARWVWPFSVLLFTQIIFGAFVAGLDAGRIYTTWPQMQGAWVPDGLTADSPLWGNLVNNATAVQFVHRWLAMVVAVAAMWVALRLYRAGAPGLATALSWAVSAQVILGVLTLLHSVPVSLGVAHQLGAVLLLMVIVAAAHWARGGARHASHAQPTIVAT
ncbi:MAG: COX15/CtaA family protein [Microthrixaceae bacterium]